LPTPSTEDPVSVLLAYWVPASLFFIDKISFFPQTVLLPSFFSTLIIAWALFLLLVFRLPSGYVFWTTFEIPSLPFPDLRLFGFEGLPLRPHCTPLSVRTLQPFSLRTADRQANPPVRWHMRGDIRVLMTATAPALTFFFGLSSLCVFLIARNSS